MLVFTQHLVDSAVSVDWSSKEREKEIDRNAQPSPIDFRVYAVEASGMAQNARVLLKIFHPFALLHGAKCDF